MGWWKRKKKEVEQTVDPKEALRQLKRSKKGLSREETAQIVRAVIEQIDELRKQIAVSQKEYEAVTSYLTDLQKMINKSTTRNPPPNARFLKNIFLSCAASRSYSTTPRSPSN